MNDLTPIVEDFVDQFFAKWQRQMKMAMLVVQTYFHLKDHGHHVTDVEVGEIIYKIIQDKNFATFGDITNWRHSEIVPREYL